MIIYIILFVQALIHRTRPLVERYVIRDYANFENLGLKTVFSVEFYKNLSIKQIGSIFSLASWRLVTYPLGLLVSSQSLQITYAASLAIGNAFELFFIPLNLFIINRGLGEFVWNTKTSIGLVVVLVGMATASAGWYIMHTGAS